MPSESTAFRSYSKAFDTQKGVQGFTHLWDGSWEWLNGSNVVQTGAWRPLLADDFKAPNISISGVTIAVDELEGMTASGVRFQAAVSGQGATLVTEATNRWQKTKSNGFVGVFSALTGAKLLNQVQGLTKTAIQPSYIQIFDMGGVPATGSVPDFVASVQTSNNFFLNLAEAGVQFNSGIQIVNSVQPDYYSPVGAADFIAAVVYK